MTLTIQLTSEKEAALNAAVEAQGTSKEEWLRDLVEERSQKLAELPSSKQPCSPLSARIREIWTDMPPDVRAEYPEGGASQIDHNVYGLPKR